MEQKIIQQADFHPVLKTYLYITVLLTMFATVVGIILIPVWLIMGGWYCKRYFSFLKCYVTEQTLVLEKGYWFRVEKTIPLDKIQDLTLREDPLLRAFGIYKLEIETAGQSNPQGSSDAKIIGIRNAKEFRKVVLSQRDKMLGKDQPKSFPAETDTNMTGLLTEIRDSLRNIEDALKKQ